jgi:hypothetical protein
MKYSVIYVPGLGDKNPKGQRALVNMWRFWGVTPHFVQMYWADGEAFELKLKRITDKIDALHAEGNKIGLVGSSAGAGAAINAFAARKEIVSGVVTICGKINHPEDIGPKYSGPNPAFVGSAFMVQKSLDQLSFKHERKRIQSRYAFIDPLVTTNDSRVTGGKNRMVPTIGHSTTIATQMIFAAPFFLHWLKKIH